MNGTILQPSRERETDRERERQLGRNIDGEIERERDATLSRLILKFCTQEPAVNHAKNSQRQKAVICLVYEWRNNMDARRALSLASGGREEE